MSLDVMKFKNYIWPHNPSNIDISVKRNLKEFAIPFKGSVIQDYGREKRIVSGSGQFFGDNSIEQFNSLFTLFKQGGQGYLSLPGMDSFLAIFKELNLIELSMTNIVNYSFEFWEDLNFNSLNLDIQNQFYTILDGDSLWTIASKFDISIETLLALNSNIKKPNQLVIGEKVRLK